MRIIICFRKFEDTVERIYVFNVIEKLMGHGIHCSLCLPCSYTNDVKVLLPYYDVILILSDVIGMTFCQGTCTKHSSWLFPSWYGFMSSSHI